MVKEEITKWQSRSRNAWIIDSFLLHHLSASLLSSCSNEFNERWNSCTLWLCCSWCSFRHLMRRFWNQTLTWASVNRSAWARYNLSGPTIYCWRANSPSKRSNCSAVKMVRTLFTLPPPPELELELLFFVEPSWPASTGKPTWRVSFDRVWERFVT